jgi:ketosteroid isomerase-like protein
MNSAERLWRGIARRDWDAVRAQFHSSATIERLSGPDSHTSVGVDELIAAYRADAARGDGDGDVEVLHALTDGRFCVIEARAGDRRCAGIYDLHDGRIAGATEYWA